ncbi:XRE family transcriptional regulator [Halodesulfovibrio aestuarii]|uniref:XRE family transcriptional regulator n=1 Tax=Halodesulfovibrio aestuarii TaxID=126333 RepID=A0ABV4JW89_9BACT
MPFEDFPKRLLQVIHALRLEQQEFGQVGRVKKTTFSNYVLGNSQPKMESLALWVDTYNINANWLLIGEGEMFRSNAEDKKKVQETSQESLQDSDPVVRRMETATRLLEKAGASPEKIQDAIMKILDSQNEPHTQAEANTVNAPAFADKCEWGMKRT